MKAFIGRRSRRLLLAVVALFAIAGGIAYATIPDAVGVYTACKLRATGTIRLIDKTPGAFPAGSLLAKCTSLEDEISWSQRGLKGDPGTPGANGAPGATGATGAQGRAGSDGAPGQSVTQAGAATADCPNGGVTLTAANGTNHVCNGTDGTDGVDGAKGDPCLSSDPACRGPQGEQGLKGETGDPCLPTTPACVGPQGPASTNDLWASVASNAVLIGHGSGVTAVNKPLIHPGQYYIQFDRNVSTCALIGSTTQRLTIEVHAGGSGPDPTQVTVIESDGLNSAGGVNYIDSAFSVAAIC